MQCSKLNCVSNILKKFQKDFEKKTWPNLGYHQDRNVSSIFFSNKTLFYCHVMSLETSNQQHQHLWKWKFICLVNFGFQPQNEDLRL